MRRSLVFLLLALAAPARAADPPPAPKGVHYIYLVRHGIYDRDDNIDDVTGNGLNAVGHDQAKLIGARLAALPVKFHSLVASNYRRAKETAADIAEILHTTAIEDTLIHECRPRSDRPDLMKDQNPAELDACEDNLKAAWSKYFSATPDGDTYDILVCHGNVIRWFVSKAVGASTERWGSMDIANGSLTVITVKADGSAHLVMFSDVGHIPIDKQTWLGKGAGWGAR